MKGRAAVPWLVLAAVLLAVAVLAGSSPARRDRALDPDANGPSGAKAVVVLLEALGADVDVEAGAPAGRADTALLLDDRLDDDDTTALRAWIRGGGVLVVADPFSSLHGGGSGDCPAALDGVDVLSLGPGSAAEVERGSQCFDGFVAAEAIGDGDVVSVDDARLFTNRLLGNGDNAMLAASLLAPTGTERVSFLRGSAGSGEAQLGDLLGPRVAQALVQVAVAFAVYGLFRARRLGRPVAEPAPVSIAGSELVAAVGRLLGGRRRPGEAAATVRADLRRDLERRLGLPADAPVERLADAVADRAGLDPAWVANALAIRPVETDDDLVAVLADLDRIRAAALSPGGTHVPA